VACCLPALLGTAGLAALAHLPSLDPATALLLLVLSFGAATWGPVVLPLGLLAALLDGRRRRRQDAFSWSVLGAAVVAAVASHGWLLDAIELP
jgi:hypothetical protein